jgi:hypothetical protein
MALEITKNFVVKAPPAAVWKFLVDVQRVARCMPGAAIGDKVDDKTYTGTMTVKVGPVTSSYKGKVVFEKLDAAAYSAEIVATGQDVKGKGGADMRLTSNLRQIAPGETEVTAISKVSITGILAQMGRGMINDVSDQLFKMFSERMRAELEAEAAAAITEPEAMAAETAAQTPTTTQTPTTATATAPSPKAPEVLDLGSIGAKAAGRAAARVLTMPVFWLIVIAIAALLYFILR